MAKRVPNNIIHAFDKKFMFDEILEKTVIFLFKNFFYIQNPLPQVCFHRNKMAFQLCPTAYSAETNISLKAEFSLYMSDNNICTVEMIAKELCSNFVSANYSQNFAIFFAAPQRNLHYKFSSNHVSSISPSKQRNTSQEYLFHFKKNYRFLNLNFLELFSKILQQAKGESKEELEENWGGSEAFKLIIFLKENFNDVVNKSPAILVFFSARWCSHCAQLRKPFGKAALMAKEAKLAVSFAMLDVNFNPDIADANDVVGIPILKYYEGGKFVSNYKGKRTAEDIFEFVKNPPKKELSQETPDL